MSLPASVVADRVRIGVESPLQDDVRAMVAALNAASLALTPAEFCHHMTVEQMADPATTLFVARAGDGRALAMGALRRHGDMGEVKRMFTWPEARGQGLGGAILAEVEALARREGLDSLVLETGTGYHWAIRIYERGGFVRCAPVLDYVATDWNVFFSKPLRESPSAS